MFSQSHRVEVRKVAAVAFFSSLAGGAVWLTGRAVRPNPLPVGAPLPHIAARGRGGAYRLQADGQGAVLVVWFQNRCVHCQYEFGLLSRNVAGLGRVRIYLLTGEGSLPYDQLAAAWPGLTSSDRITWGTVPSAEFERAFGTARVPALFLFDAHGRLRHKVVGETKLGFIVAMLAKDAVRDSGRGREAVPAGCGDERSGVLATPSPGGLPCGRSPRGR